ncbi:TPA: hypothetical protein ACPHTX_004402 [Vibrio antiquarius]
MRYLIFSLLLVSTAKAAVREHETELVKSAEKIYEIEYEFGSDKFLYEYSAFVFSHMEQNGSSSTLTHPIDTRRCSYSVNGYVERKGYFVTGGGQKVPFDKVQKKYTQSIRKHPIPKLIDQISGQHKTCGHYMEEFNSAKEQSKNAAIGLLTEIVHADTISFEEKNILKKNVENIKKIRKLDAK